MSAPRLDFIAKVNTSAERLSELLDERIRKTGHEFWKADSAEISRRLRQLILRENHYSLYRQLLKVEWPNVKLHIYAGGKVTLSPNVGFDAEIAPALVARKLFRMFGVGLVSIGKVFQNLFRKKSQVSALSIVRYPHLVDYIPGNRILSEFYDFCFEGKFDFLRESDLIVCSHSSDEKSRDGKLVLTTDNPFFCAIEHVPYSIFDTIRFVISLIGLYFRFVFLCMKFPLVAVLANDVAFWPLVHFLDGTGSLKNVVINTSQLYDQEIWLHSDSDRGYLSRCIWYGMSLRELEFKGVPPVEWPALKLFRCDHNYLWNEYHADEVRRHLPQGGESHIVFSNLWYKPILKTAARERKRIILFVTNPKKNEVIRGYFTSEFFYYGSYEVQERFYSDVIAAVREYEQKHSGKVEILIKLKRFLDNPIYDPRIRELTARMEKDGCRIFDLNDREAKDLYHEIFNSDLTICTPMSTPNFLASELGKSGIYYDPTDTIQEPEGLRAYKIYWASQPQELSRILAEILDQSGDNSKR